MKCIAALLPALLLLSAAGNTITVWYHTFVDGDYGWIASGVTDMER